MPGRLQDRIALITGASSGIGRATALLFASEGAAVVCADINEQSWRQQPPEDEEQRSTTHDRIASSGGRSMFVRCDVADPASVEAAVASAVSAYGRLDIMINNAGIAVGASDGASQGVPVWETTPESFTRQQSINVNGVFYGIKYAAAQMIKQDPLPCGDRGWILNAASVLGLVGLANSSAYCASKGAVANLTRAAALDCAPHRVHVNAVNPGFVHTRLTDSTLRDSAVHSGVDMLHPFGGVGEPESVARAYLFLASEDAGWITGVNLPVDGGFTAR